MQDEIQKNQKVHNVFNLILLLSNVHKLLNRKFTIRHFDYIHHSLELIRYQTYSQDLGEVEHLLKKTYDEIFEKYYSNVDLIQSIFKKKYGEEIIFFQIDSIEKLNTSKKLNQSIICSVSSRSIYL